MTRRSPARRQTMAAVAIALWLMAALFLVTGCGPGSSAASPTPQATAEQAAKVEKNATTGIARITLSERAIQRLDLKTATVRAGDGTVSLSLPYEALLYDAHGGTWVYTNPGPRVFQRQAVTVQRIEAGVVSATAGPPAGTVIVTTGAAELFGAEFDTAH